MQYLSIVVLVAIVSVATCLPLESGLPGQFIFVLLFELQNIFKCPCASSHSNKFNKFLVFWWTYVNKNHYWGGKILYQFFFNYKFMGKWYEYAQFSVIIQYLTLTRSSLFQENFVVSEDFYLQIEVFKIMGVLKLNLYIIYCRGSIILLY